MYEFWAFRFVMDIYLQGILLQPNPDGDGAGVPVPDAGGDAPVELVNAVQTGLNLLAWAGTAAGVIGVLACGTVMAISHKRGESSEHMGRLGLVLAGCVLVMAAGPVVTWVFANGAAEDE